MRNFDVLASVQSAELNDMIPFAVGSKAARETQERALKARLEPQLARLLAPYGMDVGEKEFVNCDTQFRENYETLTEVCVRTPGGRIILMYDHAFLNKYFVDESGVVRRHTFGRLHHNKITKKSKRYLVKPDYPINKLFPTLQQYADFCHLTFNEVGGGYGYYANPQATWYSYQITNYGFFPRVLLVKDDCPGIFGSRDPSDIFYTMDAPEGYRWVAGARKADIEWTMMKQLYVENATESFYELERGFISKKLPVYVCLNAIINDKGIIDSGTERYRKGETLAQYLMRIGLGPTDEYPFSVKACIDDQGWIEDDRPCGKQYSKVAQRFIARQPEDAWFILLDCFK